MRLALAALFRAGIVPAQSTIDGRVVDSVTRGGIEGVSVEFYTQQGVHFETITASDGSFHISGVEQGAYLHSIEKEGFEPPRRPEIPGPEPTTQVNGKDPVQVVFEMTAWTTLRGRVVDDDGKPAAGVPVQIRGPVSPREGNQIRMASDGTFQFNRLLPAFSSPESLIDKVITTSDGTFEFPSVPAGDWRIAASSEWQYEEATRRDIQLTGEARAFLAKTDIEGLEIRLAGNFEFSASVVWPKDDSPAGRFGMIALRSESPRPESDFGAMKPDGTIRFEQMWPGRYFVAPIANGTSDIYVAEVQFGGRDVLGQAIDLTPNPPPMSIVYKSGGGVVRAQFEKEAPAIFVLIPAEPQGGSPRSVPCDSKGPCEFRGLRPGDYFAAGFDHVDGVKLSDPEYVSNLIQSATRVHVAENGNELLNLPINHWPDP
jgi:Carboxypeptidase regulatory-like domain